MPKKVNYNECFNKIKSMHPTYDFREYIFINMTTKSKVSCPIHGAFESRPGCLIKGHGCPKCGGSMRLTINEFTEKVQLVHPMYDFKNFIYINNHTKGNVGCPEHGVFEAKPHNLLAGKGCPKCNGGIKLNQVEFIERVIIIHPTYDFSKFIYAGWNVNGKVICPLHGLFETFPNNLLNGFGCGRCSGRNKTTEDFVNEVSLINKKDDFSKFVYINCRTKGIVICPLHQMYEASPSNLLKGTGCPKCKESKGEKFISNWLKNNNIEFISQKKFSTCKNIRELPFDFYIQNKNLLIEYDGRHHYKAINFFGGEKGLAERMKNDSIKTNWSIENDFLLIRPNYLMSNDEIVKILEKELL